jgi:hypothetical protein
MGEGRPGGWGIARQPTNREGSSASAVERGRGQVAGRGPNCASGRLHASSITSRGVDALARSAISRRLCGPPPARPKGAVAPGVSYPCTGAAMVPERDPVPVSPGPRPLTRLNTAAQCRKGEVSLLTVFARAAAADAPCCRTCSIAVVYIAVTRMPDISKIVMSRTLYCGKYRSWSEHIYFNIESK